MHLCQMFVFPQLFYNKKHQKQGACPPRVGTWRKYSRPFRLPGAQEKPQAEQQNKHQPFVLFSTQRQKVYQDQKWTESIKHRKSKVDFDEIPWKHKSNPFGLNFASLFGQIGHRKRQETKSKAARTTNWSKCGLSCAEIEERWSRTLDQPYYSFWWIPLSIKVQVGHAVSEILAWSSCKLLHNPHQSALKLNQNSSRHQPNSLFVPTKKRASVNFLRYKLRIVLNSTQLMSTSRYKYNDMNSISNEHFSTVCCLLAETLRAQVRFVDRHVVLI